MTSEGSGIHTKNVVEGLFPKKVENKGKGGHDGGMDDLPSRVAVLEQIAKDTKDTLTRIESRVDGLFTTIIGTGLAIIAIIISVLAYGGTVFGNGFSARDIVHAVTQEQAQHSSSPAPHS